MADCVVVAGLEAEVDDVLAGVRDGVSDEVCGGLRGEDVADGVAERVVLA